MVREFSVVIVKKPNPQFCKPMRNEIALPADILDAAQQLAQSLGLSSSELFTAALSDFIQRHNTSDITAALDKVYSETDSSLDPILSTIQLKSLPKENW